MTITHFCLIPFDIFCLEADILRLTCFMTNRHFNILVSSVCFILSLLAVNFCLVASDTK
jgi:hypothetical protein